MRRCVGYYFILQEQKFHSCSRQAGVVFIYFIGFLARWNYCCGLLSFWSLLTATPRVSSTFEHHGSLSVIYLCMPKEERKKASRVSSNLCTLKEERKKALNGRLYQVVDTRYSLFLCEKSWRFWIYCKKIDKWVNICNLPRTRSIHSIKQTASIFNAVLSFLLHMLDQEVDTYLTK